MIRALLLMSISLPAWGQRFILLDVCTPAGGREALSTTAIVRISKGTKRGCSTVHYGAGTVEIRGTIKQLLCKIQGYKFCAPINRDRDR